MTPFSPDQSRFLADLAQHYSQWLTLSQEGLAFSGWMTWKKAKGKLYLYHGKGAGQTGKSLGVQNEQTLATYETFTKGKAENKEALAEINSQLATRAPLIRAAGLGKVHPLASKVLRQLDVASLLDHGLLVSGTNCLPAYEVLSAQQFSSHLSATEDLDLNWQVAEKTELVVKGESPSLVKLLKSIDSTFTVNSERNFQMLNKHGYAVELLGSHDSVKSYPRDPLSPMPLDGQDWLIAYPTISAVAADAKGLPVRIIAPDPRVFALHKEWVSHRPDRNPLKVEKDRRQSEAVLAMIDEHLPSYRLTDEFITSLPSPLQEIADKLPRPSTNFDLGM